MTYGPTYSVCTSCTKRNSLLHCPATRHETQWVWDKHGKSRRVTGGVCAKTETGLPYWVSPKREDAA